MLNYPFKGMESGVDAKYLNVASSKTRRNKTLVQLKAMHFDKCIKTRYKDRINHILNQIFSYKTFSLIIPTPAVKKKSTNHSVHLHDDENK